MRRPNVVDWIVAFAVYFTVLAVAEFVIGAHDAALARSGLGVAPITRTVYEQVQLKNISNGNPPKWSDIVDTSLWKAAYKAVTPKKKH